MNLYVENEPCALNAQPFTYKKKQDGGENENKDDNYPILDHQNEAPADKDLTPESNSGGIDAVFFDQGTDGSVELSRPIHPTRSKPVFSLRPQSASCMVFAFCASHFPLLVYVVPSLVLFRVIWIFYEGSVPKDLSIFCLLLTLAWVMACGHILADYPALWWLWVIYYAYDQCICQNNLDSSPSANLIPAR
jgi:hypothetical protein